MPRNTHTHTHTHTDTASVCVGVCAYIIIPTEVIPHTGSAQQDQINRLRQETF